MSYILDALKRAEAERERGQVPGLNAQPVVVAAADAPGGRFRRWLWPAVAAIALAAAGLAWRMGTPPAPKAPAVVAVAPVSLPAQPTVTVSLPPIVATTPVAQRAPAPVATQTPQAAAKPAPVPKTPKAVSAPQPAPPTESRVFALNELPEALRRDLPKLTVTGSVYSTNPAQRMLILNGQVFNEGSSPALDLKVQSIGAKSAVMDFRGTRYRLDY